MRMCPSAHMVTDKEMTLLKQDLQQVTVRFLFFLLVERISVKGQVHPHQVDQGSNSSQ